jgi:hypothetical protein
MKKKCMCMLCRKHDRATLNCYFYKTVHFFVIYIFRCHNRARRQRGIVEFFSEKKMPQPDIFYISVSKLRCFSCMKNITFRFI